MNLRTQLKNTRMQKGEMIQEYFSRISEFKEQLEAIGDTIDEDELIMTALNGLTRPWDVLSIKVALGWTSSKPPKFELCCSKFRVQKFSLS